MFIRVYVKGDEVCYSTVQSLETSEREEKLISLGWKMAGGFSGRDISSYSRKKIRTMTEVLKEARG